MSPLCFVLMPFGVKKDPPRPDIDFDRVYEDAIEPAIRDAGMEPLRADEERTSGVIHKALFERLLLCDFAVADLTTANPNVFYAFGARHGMKPRTTVAIFGRHLTLPFDVDFLRALPYDIGENNRFGPDEAKALREALASRLKTAREQASVDSPVYQVLQNSRVPELAHLVTDVFRERTQYSEQLKARLAEARQSSTRQEGVARLKSVEGTLGPLDGVESGVLVDLFLSFRAVEAWDEMIRLFEQMPEPLRRTAMVREQYAFALNRRAGKGGNPADRMKALQVLEQVEKELGTNPETHALMGRIYKDLWDEALKAGKALEAKGHLLQAIEAYARGFESDWRDTLPGINAVTLLELEGSPGSLERRDRLRPVVRFAVEQRLRYATGDYWDHATVLELAVLGSDQELAKTKLADALAVVRETWEPRTTARNLDLIRTARLHRGEKVDWLEPLIAALRERAQG
ncbi:TRAFs-binding domain-containing protein [Archangium sp.]|uniref:TRAFs-binding domain-containing protein n=1 Tax=Archangium sp. TaxID=1872627 RepID=UPI00286A5F4E|nr:TRAFs-binding domain-containing protein [Archangium sp.]